MLPADLSECLNDLFSLTKTQAGPTIYKMCKKQILAVHGPKPEEDYLKAKDMVLVGLPSDTAKRIRDLVCQRTKKLDNCCCHVAVSALWRGLLPPAVKAAVAGMDLETDFNNVLRLADDVYKATQPKSAATVAAFAAKVQAQEGATAAEAGNFDVNDFADKIAAFARTYKGRGVTRPPRRGGSQSARAPAKPEEKAPDNACWLHKKYGKKAFHCAAKTTCPWKDFCVQKE